MSWCCIPSTFRLEETPKQRWKREQSWKRWERRYGKPKELLKGEIGTYDGFRFITSKVGDGTTE